MIQNFTWNNGTLDSPIVLTTNQISTLIAAGNNPNINASVKGVIRSSTGIYKYLKYSLNKLFGSDLVVLGDEVADTFQISAPTSNLLEGNSMALNVSSPSGMKAEDLQYKLIFGTVQTDNVLNEEGIKSRISIEGGVLKIAQSQENGSWVIPVTVRACPLYENIDTTTNYSETIPILCRAVAMTSFTATAEAEIATNSSTTIEYHAIPGNTTKLGTAEITANIAQGNGSFFDGKFYASEVTGTNVVNVTCVLAGGASFTSSVTIEVKNSTQSTITIWNGGKDGGISDPKSMVTGDTVANTVNGSIPSNAVDNVIWEIRQNSHLYVGKYMGRDIGMKLKQLSDTDRTKYSDGTDATDDINGTPGSDGIIKDVYLRLPTFYYKCVTNAENEDAVDIVFSTGQDDENSYQEWDTNTLIGVYKGAVIRNGEVLNPTEGTAYQVGDTLHSISGVKPTVWYSQSSFKRAARARNTVPEGYIPNDGFGIVTYEAHIIMALLYYGYYGGFNINCQAVIGHGTSDIAKITGATNDKGMNDTMAPTLGGTGDAGSTSWWGLENWWGDTSEFIDNIISANSTGRINIQDWQGNTVRWVQSHVPLNIEWCISKMVWNTQPGANYSNWCDMIPDEFSGNTNYTKYFCDSGYVYATTGNVARRSDTGANATGGVGCLYVYYSPSTTYSYVGSRLVFSGRVTDITGTEEANNF